MTLTAIQYLLFLTCIISLLSPIRSDYYFGNSNKNTPIFIFHGLGDNCHNIAQSWMPELKKKQNFKHVFCVESGGDSNSYLKNMTQQVTNAANYIVSIQKDQKYTQLINDGIFFLGLSQGGIIARMVFNNFPKISKLVRRIMTFGSPQTGIDELDGMTGSTTVDSLLSSLLSTDFGTYMSSAGFFMGKSDKDFKTGNFDITHPFYTLNCNLNVEELFHKLNTQENKILNEQSKSTLYNFLSNCIRIKEEYNHLEMMVNVAYLNDEVVNPPNSAVFRSGIVEVNSIQQIKRVEKSSNRQKDKWVGLKTAYNDITTQINSMQSELNNPNHYINIQISETNSQNGQTSKSQQKQIKKNFMAKLKHYPGLIQNMKTQQTDLLNKTQRTFKQFDLLSKDKAKMLQITNHVNNDYKFYIPNAIRETSSYKNNAINYRRLYDNNRLMNCVINGTHLETTNYQKEQIAVRLLGLRTPRIRGKDGQYDIEDGVPFIRPEKVAALRLYCDFGALSFPKQYYRLLI